MNLLKRPNGVSTSRTKLTSVATILASGAVMLLRYFSIEIPTEVLVPVFSALIGLAQWFQRDALPK